MKRKFSEIVVVLLAITASCDQRDPIQSTENYSWRVSSISPKNSFMVYEFKIGSDKKLYAMGTSGTQIAFGKLEGENWEIIAMVDEMIIIDFIVYKDAVYYSTYTTLKRATGPDVEIVLEVEFARLEEYQDKLIITGTPILLDGKKHTIISYDGENTFKSIDQGIQSHTMKKVNDKLFIGGHPLKTWDGKSLVSLEYSGGYLNIDIQELVYSWGTTNDESVIIHKFVNGKFMNVGNSIKTKAIINDLEFIGQSIFICGFDVDRNISESYFFNKLNQWTRIETSGHISDLIAFQDMLFAATYDGPIFELVAE